MKQNLLRLLLLIAYVIPGHQTFSNLWSGYSYRFILMSKAGTSIPVCKDIKANVNVTERPDQHKAIKNLNQSKSTNRFKKPELVDNKLISVGEELVTTSVPVSFTVSQSYSLSAAAKTSAGVFDGDILIRTLWSNEQTNAGTYSLANVWDGKDDRGNYVADKNYTVKVVSSNATYEWLRPIGNTSEEMTGETVHTHFGPMGAMVQVGSNMYFSVGYNETNTMHHKFAIGTPNRVTTTLKGGGQCTRFLATDGNIVYYGGQQNSDVTFITGIVPNPTGIDYLASFSSGKPFSMATGSPFTYSAFDISDKNNFITGMAVQKTGSYLFATHNSVNELRVYNKNTGAFVRTINVYGARNLAMQNNNLWISHYSSHTGSTTPVKLTGTLVSKNPATANANAFDGTSSIFRTYGGPRNHIGLRFSSRVIVTKVRIKPEAGQPMNAEVLGNTESENTFLSHVEIPATNSGNWIEYNVTNANPFNKVKLLSNSDAPIRIEELEIYGYAYSGEPIITKHTVNADGTISAAITTINKGIDVELSFAISPDGTKLAMANKGVYDQVKFYNTSTGALLSTFGRAENYSNPTVYNDKFYWYQDNWFEDDYGGGSVNINYQTDGSFWIRDTGNYRCQHFAGDNSYIDQIQLLGFSYSTQADPNNPTRVFSNFNEFAINYTDNSWTYVRNWAKNITIPTVYDPDRMRSVATLSNGRTYCLYTGEGGPKEVLELDLVTGLRHTGVYLDNVNCDLNPDGSQWQIGTNQTGQPTFWRRKPLTGFDGNNNPVWGSYVTIESIPIVQPGDPLITDGYLRRMAQTSDGTIATFSPARGGGFHLGGRKSGQWKFLTSPATRPDYVGDFPNDGSFDIGNGVGNAGSFMQVVDRNIFWGYTGEFWKGMQTNMYNHYLENGLMVGQFGYWKGFLTRPDNPPAVAGDAGNANTGTYVKVGNDIHFYHADEKQHGGSHHWKISNLSSIQEYSVPITKAGVPTLAAPAYIDLMAGLPSSGTLTTGVGRWSFSQGFTAGWEALAGLSTYKKNDRSLQISAFVAQGQTKDASCDLLVTSGATNNLTSWRIEGQLRYPEIGEDDGNYVEVADNTGKVIVRISRPSTYPITSVKANGVTIMSGNEGGLIKSLFLTSQPLSIRRSGSNVLVSYAGYPEVTVTAFESGANLSAPTTLRVRLYSPGTRGHRVNLANLKLYTTSTVMAGTGTGLAGEYFNNSTLTAPAAAVRTDSTVNFSWSINSPIPGTIKADNFSARWSGQVQAPVSGTYVFSTSSDNGMRLWVNRVLVIDNWVYHGRTIDYSTPIVLTAGQKYDLKVEYNEGSGGASMRLMWAYPGKGQQPIPKPYLYPATITTPGGRVGTSTSDISTTENAEWLNDVKLYPVPAYDNLWIQYYAQEAGDLVVKLISIVGQPVLVSAQRVKQGENTLKIPVKELTRGVYIMNLTQDYRQVTRRVILSDQ